MRGAPAPETIPQTRRIFFAAPTCHSLDRTRPTFRFSRQAAWCSHLPSAPRADDWSDDELETIDGDTPVVPLSMLPTPQVLSNGSSSAVNGGENRGSAYNERMSRARNASTLQRKSVSGGAGMMMMNNERPTPAYSQRPSVTLAQAPALDVLSQEIEEMEMAEEEQTRHTADLRRQNEVARETPPPPQHYAAPPTPTQTSYGANAPIDIGDGDDDHPPVSYAPPYRQQSSGYDSSPEQSRDAALAPQDLPPPSSSSRGDVAIQRPLNAMAPAVIDTSDLKAFLMRPGPQGAMVQCYIQRRKSGLARLYPTYEVYLKDGEQFLLAARRRKKQKQSNYKVSLDREDLSRNSSNYFGKLKSNFMGTQFEMYDKGINPEKLSRDQREGSGSQVRQELATVMYKQNVLGSRGPRKMKVLVPNVDENGQRKMLKPIEPDDTMASRYLAGKDNDDFQVLKNKQPKWNDQVGAYVLNFNGRVTRASVKNFQLCNQSKDPDLVVMQFGRVGKDAFTMDYQYPLCALQAFGIALSSFDYKIACE